MKDSQWKFLRDVGNAVEFFYENFFFFSGLKVKVQRETRDKMAEIWDENEEI